MLQSLEHVQLFDDEVVGRAALGVNLSALKSSLVHFLDGVELARLVDFVQIHRGVGALADAPHQSILVYATFLCFH